MFVINNGFHMDIFPYLNKNEVTVPNSIRLELYLLLYYPNAHQNSSHSIHKEIVLNIQNSFRNN